MGLIFNSGGLLPQLVGFTLARSLTEDAWQPLVGSCEGELSIKRSGEGLVASSLIEDAILKLLPGRAFSIESNLSGGGVSLIAFTPEAVAMKIDSLVQWEGSEDFSGEAFCQLQLSCQAEGDWNLEATWSLQKIGTHLAMQEGLGNLFQIPRATIKLSAHRAIAAQWSTQGSAGHGEFLGELGDDLDILLQPQHEEYWPTVESPTLPGTIVTAIESGIGPAGDEFDPNELSISIEPVAKRLRWMRGKLVPGIFSAFERLGRHVESDDVHEFFLSV